MSALLLPLLVQPQPHTLILSSVTASSSSSSSGSSSGFGSTQKTRVARCCGATRAWQGGRDGGSELKLWREGSCWGIGQGRSCSRGSFVVGVGNHGGAGEAGGKNQQQQQVESSAVAAAAVGGGDGGDGGGDLGGDGGDGGDGRGHGLLVPAAGLWSRYTELLDRHPLVVKSVTAGLLNAVADFVCQVVVERENSVDLRRLLSFVAIGVCMSGPGLHFWYGALTKVISVPGMGGVVLRTAADQLVFTPLGVVGFFVVLLTLEGRQAELSDKLQKDVLDTVVANWKVWIPFQIVNFGFVPPQLQVAAAGILGVVWSIFISYKGHT